MSDVSEIILRDDGLYEIKIVYPKAKLIELVRDSFGYRENLSSYVTKALADKFVNENYSELKKLIDLDLVKLLATRQLAGVVAGKD